MTTEPSNAGVVGDLAQGFFNGAHDDLDTELSLGQSHLLGGLDAAHQGDAAAGNDALFHGGPGGVEGVFHAGFFSFISVSVAAPTLMTATPPMSLARRSCSFSRS
jgi:hypothetical protein